MLRRHVYDVDAGPAEGADGLAEDDGGAAALRVDGVGDVDVEGVGVVEEEEVEDGAGETLDAGEGPLGGGLAGEGVAEAGVEVLNDVVLNQVLVRVEGADPDARTREMIAGVQQDGTCWAGGTTWHGMAALRISISNWSTTERDIDRSAEAILAATDAVVARWQT